MKITMKIDITIKIMHITDRDTILLLSLLFSSVLSGAKNFSMMFSPCIFSEIFLRELNFPPLEMNFPFSSAGSTKAAKSSFAPFKLSSSLSKNNSESSALSEILSFC